MAIQILNTQITLDLYDYDKTPAKIKTIQLDSKTRYVDATIQYRGATYDIGQDTEVVLTVIRPDGTGVQITGEPIAHTESSPEGGAVTTYGAYAEFTPAALAKKGALKAQFMLISGDQVMRTEIFTIANEVALDESTDTWAGEYQGYNLDELVQNVNTAVGKVNAMAQDVSELKSGFTKLTTATAEDVGKALKAKTVTDGKVVEWEFGETGDTEALEEQISAAVSKKFVYSGNLADTTGVIKTGQYTNYVEFELVGDGTYYTNPFSNDGMSDTSAKYEISLLDELGNVITLTKDSDQSQTAVIGSYRKIILILDGTTLTYTYYLNNGNNPTVTYNLSAVPSKIRYRTRWWDADKAQINGFTFGFSSETYVPYSAPTTEYHPNDDFADEIKDYYVENGFLDKTLRSEGSAANAKAVGDELYDRLGIEFETVNGWIRPENGNLIVNTGNTATDFIPVTPGEVIRVNRPALQTLTENAYYNASKTFVSAVTTPSNVTDLTIPSGVYYVRFSDYNAGMVGFTVERTGLWTRIRDAISESSGEAEYRHLIDQSRYGGNPLTLLHFSDLHMDATTMGFINAFRLNYADLLDDTIQTGDVCNGFSNDWSTLVSLGLGECLGVIGNHEALGDSKNSATQQELHEKFIKPYISAWNVTQPTGVNDSASEHYCANYYYKDYTTATVRLIVLDTQKWSTAQMNWFTATLESARTAGYAVIVASHVLPGKVTITDCNFSAKYIGGKNVPHAFPTDDAPLVTEDAVSAVNDFITAGGEFVIWIGGHEHADIFGVFTSYPNVTAYMIDKASINRETPGAARLSGEKNQHAFNIMSVVRSGKLLKIVRIGEDVDGLMRGKHVFCYNYNTKTVISQW